MDCNANNIKKIIEDMSTFTEKGENKYTRLSYTKEDLDSRKYIIEKMNQIGLNVYMDYIGNILGLIDKMNKDKPIILVGSHIDTVKNGGKFDGVAGVAAALEIANVIKENDNNYPLGVIIFTEEEGNRFNSSLLGSRWATGELQEGELNSLMDNKGVLLVDAIKNLDILNEYIFKRCFRFTRPVKAFFELHSEQGPVLENKNKDIGIVDKITGSSVYEVGLFGRADHAGTMPMNMRKDAFLVLSKVNLELNQYVIRNYRDMAVATIGYINLKPCTPNVIPGETTFTMDIRSHSKKIMDDIIEHITSYIIRLANNEDMKYKITQKYYAEPVELSSHFIDNLKKNAVNRNYKYMDIASGAGHDAMKMSSITDVGMVFVPSKDGRSHCPEEFSSYENITYGANIILDTILEMI